MGERFHVAPAELRGYSELLGRNAQHFLTIKEHAVTKGGDTAGFTGLLSLLHPVVTGVANLYGETLDFANKMMVREQEALVKAAEMYENVDRTCVRMAEDVMHKLSGARPAPQVGGGR
jgi:hypothetical protein